MNKLNDITQRFIEVYEYLLKINQVQTISDFAKKIGVSSSMITEINKKRSNVGVKAIQNTVSQFEMINVDWLITGKGKMTEFYIPEIKYSKDADEEWAILKYGIPLIPLDAMAGFGTGESQIMDYETERYIVPEFEELNVEFMIRVKGSSMYPKYSSGDIVACKKLPLDTFFQWNKVYVLDTEQGPMIKRVKKSELKDHLLCVSENEKYDPFDLHLNHLNALAIVIGVIRLE